MIAGIGGLQHSPDMSLLGWRQPWMRHIGLKSLMENNFKMSQTRLKWSKNRKTHTRLTGWKDLLIWTWALKAEKTCCVNMSLKGWKDLLIWTWALKAEKNCCVNMSPLGRKDLLIGTWASKAEKEMFWEHEPLRAEVHVSHPGLKWFY